MSNKKEVGEMGENIAKNYLIKNGYKIIAQNFFFRKDEIDIVASDPAGVLVFCEVKTLTQNPQGQSGFMPEDNLNPNKLRKLIRSAQLFAGRYPNLIEEEKGWRIDLIAVVLDDSKNVLDIRHYENI